MKSILTFVHIEKAAGTSLIHILRRNFLLRYADIRPLDKEAAPVVGAADLKKVFSINPFVRCVGGHAVYPMVMKELDGYDFRFITVLRNPLKRYVSQFAYLYSIGRISNDFSAFLEDDQYRDFQTYKLASSYDVQAANAMLDSMAQVGVVEDFDGFLVRLARTVGGGFDPHYRRKNTTKPLIDQKQLLDKYEKEIRARNQCDLQVYQHATDAVLPKLIDAYGTMYEKDLAKFKEENMDCSEGGRPYIDYAYRKLYFEPVTGIMRRRNGLLYKGSYWD